MRIVILFLLILISIKLIKDRKNKNIGIFKCYPSGKNRLKDIDFPKNWRTSDNKLPITHDYDMSNLPNNFINDKELNKYINKHIYPGIKENVWNIYDFYISDGFYFTEYECESTMIFVFIENWNILMNFVINVNDKYIAPEKNTIYILQKGDKIFSTEFSYKQKTQGFNFILLY